MENQKNKILLISTIIVLLLSVGAIFIYLGLDSKNKEKKLKIEQLYISDYDLYFLGDNYFYGTYNNKIGVIIDNKGKEIYKNNNGITYDNIYELQNGNFLIYNNIDNELHTYIFDGTKIDSYYNIKEVSNIIPILYTKDDKQYLISFAEQKDNNLYLYNLDNKGIIVLQDTILTNIKDGYKTNNSNSIIIKKNNKYGVVDLEGNILIEEKYPYLESDSNGNYIAKNEKNNYGIINKNNETILKFNYKLITESNSYYLVVNTNNKLSLYDKNITDLLNFKMNYNDTESLSYKLYKIDNNLIIINNVNEKNNKYKYHNLYYIKDNKIEKTITQYGFNKNELIYTISDKNIVTFYDYKMNEIDNLELDPKIEITNIEKINNKIKRLTYIEDEKEKTKYYNEDNEEVEESYGTKILETSTYLVYRNDKEKEDLTIYDLDGNKITDVNGDKIRIKNNYLIIDKGIYKIEMK